MRLRFSWPACAMAIGLMAGGGLWAQAPAPPVMFPPATAAPAPLISITNTVRATRKDGLKYLEEELSKSLQFLSGKHSLEGVLAPPPLEAPPPRLVMPSKAKKKDSDDPWLSFGANNSQETEETAEFLRPGANRAEPQDNSLREVYRRLNQKTPGATDYDGTKRDQLRSRYAERKGKETDPLRSRYSDRDNDRDATKGDPLRSRYAENESEWLDASEDAALPSSIREKASSLRKILGGEIGGRDDDDATAFRPGEYNLLELPRSSLGRADVQSHQDYISRYREVLTGPASTPSLLQDPLKNELGNSPARPAVMTGLEKYAPSARQDGAAGSGLSSIFNPATMPDLNSKVLNQWNPLYEPPRVEPPQPVALQAPPFMAPPRRRF